MLVEEMKDFCVALGLKKVTVRGSKYLKVEKYFLIGGGVIQQNVSR